MRLSGLFFLLIGMFLLVSVAARAASQDSLVQTVCPVTGSDISKDVYTNYNGQQVYFCCAQCIDKFKSDPAKYLKKMKEDLAQAAAAKPQPQTRCPVTGEEINKELYTEAEGHRVYFCCKMCVDKFKQDPAGFVKKMEDQGIELEKGVDYARYHRGAEEGEKHPQQP